MKKMSKKKLVVFCAAAIVVLAIAAVFVFGKGGSSGVQVSEGLAEMSDIQNIVSVKGTVEGVESADVYSSSNNKVASILVHEGDEVTKGQILATLDADDIASEYNIAAINMQSALSAYEKAKTLYNEGAISKDEYVDAKDSYDIAALTLSSYNITDKTNVVSPIDGTVTRVNCTVGRIPSESNNGEAMFVVENLSALQMRVNVSEHSIATVRVGQEVEISADILGGQTVKGEVIRISPSGEQNPDGSGMVIPVTISVDKGDTNLISGVTAKAKIMTDSAKNVLTVPFDAVLPDMEAGENYVFVINADNTLKKVSVHTGLEGDILIEITDGDVHEGDRVVLAPEIFYEDGMKVTPY